MDGRTDGRTECRKLCPSAFLGKGGQKGDVILYICMQVKTKPLSMTSQCSNTAYLRNCIQHMQNKGFSHDADRILKTLYRR